MERIISLSELKKAVTEAYEKYKNLNEGAVDERLGDVDTSKFGITVATASGVVFNVGDTEVASPLGAIAKIPVASILLSQNTPQELMQKSGNCCKCAAGKKVKPDVHGAKGIRAVSAIEPVGDPTSKWDFIENRMIDLMGTAPLLDTKLYEKRMADSAANDDVNKLAAADFYLYDDAEQSVDLYRRAQSMTATTEQLAVMGATIANNGVNPLTGKVVYDGVISRHIVAMMAAKGPHKMSLPWNVMAGLPARSGFGGAIVGVYPGVMSIAAYSPLLTPNKVSMRAAKAIVDIMTSLSLSLYTGENLVIATDK